MEGSEEMEVSDSTDYTVADWYASFQEIEQSLLNLLREIEGKRLRGQHEEAREMVLELSRSNIEAFRFVRWALAQHDEFLEDLEEVDQEARDRAEELGDNFTSLADEFSLVLRIRANNLENPITRVDTGAQRQGKKIIISYDGYSEQMPVVSTSEEIDAFVTLSDSIIKPVENALSNAKDREKPLDENQFELLKENHDRLQERVEAIADEIGELEEIMDTDDSE